MALEPHQSEDRPSLSNPEIERYGRQMILPEIGMKGQISLKNSSVLVVGVGGLGCPAAIYMAAAGVGCLGLLDYDEVELSNLHRQILHTERREGISKSESGATACKHYDVILDCTDNVATRYLLNDACVLAGKPLVSGSALRFEGQLTVYNHDGGPCYRCLYPRPPPPETVTNCSDGGVLGAVPGVIGTLQALEAVKIVCGISSTYSQRLLLFDGLYGTFNVIKLRPRQTTCCVCGASPTVTDLIDYVQFCGSGPNDKEYKDVVDKDNSHLLIDVRPEVEYEICKLPHSINIPMACIESKGKELLEKIVGSEVFVVCRLGNDSQGAAKTLKNIVTNLNRNIRIRDIKGGLAAWNKHVDPDFPTY